MQLLHQLVLGFPKWKWSSYEVARGKMADLASSARARELPSMEMVVIGTSYSWYNG